MKTSETSNKHQCLVLCERQTTVAGIPFLYRLSVASNSAVPQFFVSVSGNGESCNESVSSDLFNASRIFCAIADGGVTPCVLNEVLKDLLWELGLAKNG